MMSLVKPEKGISRYWDNRVIRYNGDVPQNYRHVYFCLSSDSSYGRVTCLRSDIEEVSTCTVVLQSPPGNASAELISELELFDQCAMNPLFADDYNRFTDLSDFIPFSVECLGSELGMRKQPVCKGKMKVAVCVPPQMLRRQLDWLNYEGFMTSLLERDESLYLTLVLSSSAPPAVRRGIEKLRASNGRFAVQTLSFLSDYPFVFGAHDVVINLGDPYGTRDLFTCAQSTGAVYFGFPMDATKKVGTNWQVLPGLTGWELDIKVYEGVRPMRAHAEAVAKLLSVVASRLPRFRSNTEAQYKERCKYSVAQLDDFAYIS